MDVLVVADPGSTWRADPAEPLAAAWERARRLIGYAHAAGADVIKFQLMRADIYAPETPAWHLVRPYELPEDWLPRLKAACDEEEIGFACTVYRPEDVALVDPLVPWHKVASFEISHEALLQSAAAGGKPVYVSTGVARGGDRQRARQAVGAGRSRWLRWLYCVSAYPAPVEAYAPLLQAAACARYSGVSDHTPGGCTAVGAWAAAQGASYVEKHLCEDHSAASPDAAFAAAPHQMVAYVAAVRDGASLLTEYRAGSRAPLEAAAGWKSYRYNPATGRRGQP